MTGFSVRDAMILATATRLPAENRSDEELRARLSAESRAPDVSIIFTNGPITGYHHDYGGNRVLDDGVWECTSGFTVTAGSDYGVSTAGHCDGINQYQEEDGYTYRSYYQWQHRGDWGDFEWHTTDHIAYAELYANVGDRRDTLYLESAASINEGDTYCKFGRKTGYSCDKVYLSNVTATNGSITQKRLVAMMSQKGAGGDSGGPWFISNWAAGIHHGHGQINGVFRDFWSKADYLDEALSVRVLLK